VRAASVSYFFILSGFVMIVPMARILKLTFSYLKIDSQSDLPNGNSLIVNSFNFSKNTDYQGLVLNLFCMKSGMGAW
jgi:hypothetical protein